MGFYLIISTKSISTMKLHALTIALVAQLGTAEHRSLKRSTHRRAKGAKASRSGVFSKSSKSCGVIGGDLFEDPTEASPQCQANRALSVACAHHIPNPPNPPIQVMCPNNADPLGYTNTGICLAGADITECYDLGGGVGEVTIRLQAAWDWSKYGANKCAEVLTQPVSLQGVGSAATPTAGACGDALLNPITTPINIDSTVTITLDAGYGDSFTGSLLPGGSVCEIWAWDGSAYSYTDNNAYVLPFAITLGDQDYEGRIEYTVDQSVPEALAQTSPNIILYEV